MKEPPGPLGPRPERKKGREEERKRGREEESKRERERERERDFVCRSLPFLLKSACSFQPLSSWTYPLRHDVLAAALPQRARLRLQACT